MKSKLGMAFAHESDASTRHDVQLVLWGHRGHWVLACDAHVMLLGQCDAVRLVAFA